MTRDGSAPCAVRDRASLLHAVAQGHCPRYLFFWGHRAKAGARRGKWCLSQWWPAPFVLDGQVYPTAEHYMMAEKAALFGDKEARQRILSAQDPATAKKVGRAVRGFDEARWENERFAAVVRGNLAKFDQHPSLKSFLLDTGDQILVEASPTDRIWGIGLEEGHADAVDPSKWRGLNLLGFGLMDVRDRLRESLR